MTTIRASSIPGGWSEREVTIEAHAFRLLTPTDPDALLDHLESPEATHHPHLADPYWAKLWPAAPALAGAIVRHPPPRGSTVLELGCGSGLVGIAALASGCDVTFSDYVPLAVELALENSARNGFPQAKRMILDWRQPRDEKYSLIVAADVTYDRTSLNYLLNVVEQMLVAGGEAWFGDAGRSPAEDFVARARKRGWSVGLFDEQDHPASDLPLGSYRRVVLRRM